MTFMLVMSGCMIPLTDLDFYFLPKHLFMLGRETGFCQKIAKLFWIKLICFYLEFIKKKMYVKNDLKIFNASAAIKSFF